MNMRIGSMFTLGEPSLEGSTFLTNIGDDLRFYLSGRCALYACLLDFSPGDEHKVAYVPAYTCETVLGSYLKAGYSLHFYDGERKGLKPLYDQNLINSISVLHITGYYGFCHYDEQFIQACKRRGVVVIQDTTHSLFSADGHHPLADYWAGSGRKWMGIACGGIAIKHRGNFRSEPLQPDSLHLKGRYKAMELRQRAIETNDEVFDQKAMETFWKTELRLREMFDTFGSDQRSEQILRNLDVGTLIQTRRSNYRTVLNNLLGSAQCQPVFGELSPNTCPSHFSFYSENREKAQQDLEKRGIKSTVYWPLPPMLENRHSYPEASYIYDHIGSVQIDQRYTSEDMEYLAKALSAI